MAFSVIRLLPPTALPHRHQQHGKKRPGMTTWCWMWWSRTCMAYLGGVLILQMKGKVPRGRDCFLWTWWIAGVDNRVLSFITMAPFWGSRDVRKRQDPTEQEGKKHLCQQAVQSQTEEGIFNRNDRKEPTNEQGIGLSWQDRRMTTLNVCTQIRKCWGAALGGKLILFCKSEWPYEMFVHQCT